MFLSSGAAAPAQDDSEYSEEEVEEIELDQDYNGELGLGVRGT